MKTHPKTHFQNSKIKKMQQQFLHKQDIAEFFPKTRLQETAANLLSSEDERLAAYSELQETMLAEAWRDFVLVVEKHDEIFRGDSNRGANTVVPTPKSLVLLACLVRHIQDMQNVVYH